MLAGFFLSRAFFQFFHKHVCPTMVGENFQIDGFRLLENAFASQKIESREAATGGAL